MTIGQYNTNIIMASEICYNLAQQPYKMHGFMAAQPCNMSSNSHIYHKYSFHTGIRL